MAMSVGSNALAARWLLLGGALVAVAARQIFSVEQPLGHSSGRSVDLTAKIFDGGPSAAVARSA